VLDIQKWTINYNGKEENLFYDEDSILNQLSLTEGKTRKNARVEYLDYQIPVTQLKGPNGNGDMQAAKRD